MEIDQSRILELVLRPSESLNTELKRWLNPAEPAGIAKIVKACIALRNRNGGFLIIGFDDETHQPDKGNEPADPQAQFHIDVIQLLVSRYASSGFEVGVGFGERDGIWHPVIVVPEGVQVPVAAKADLFDGNKKLIALGDVYFRTLKSNGTPSTSNARPNDWEDIIAICFENREADIGRFLRRHLGAGDLVPALTQAGLISTKLSLKERAEALLDEGRRRFDRALEDRQLIPKTQR